MRSAECGVQSKIYRRAGVYLPPHYLLYIVLFGGRQAPALPMSRYALGRATHLGKCGMLSAECKLTLRLPQWGKLSSERETDEVSCCKEICPCNTSSTANAVPPLPLERAKEAGESTLWRGLKETNAKTQTNNQPVITEPFCLTAKATNLRSWDAEVLRNGMSGAKPRSEATQGSPLTIPCPIYSK